jgi:hypothetical protein
MNKRSEGGISQEVCGVEKSDTLVCEDSTLPPLVSAFVMEWAELHLENLFDTYIGIAALQLDPVECPLPRRRRRRRRVREAVLK